jgi:hypothetical protein
MAVGVYTLPGSWGFVGFGWRLGISRKIFLQNLIMEDDAMIKEGRPPFSRPIELVDVDVAIDLLNELHRERLAYDEYSLLMDAVHLLMNKVDDLTRERDGAVEDLKSAVYDSCEFCKHDNDYADDDTCKRLSEMSHHDCWQWRGVREGGGLA